MKYLILTLLLAISFSSNARDAKQVRAFRGVAKCPITNTVQRKCPGYVVDHVVLYNYRKENYG
jgi:hypothetical protein